MQAMWFEGLPLLLYTRHVPAVRPISIFFHFPLGSLRDGHGNLALLLFLLE